MRRLRPLLRFLLLGGLLFAAQQLWLTVPAGTPRPEVVIDAARIAALEAATARRIGRAPTKEELRALVQQLADEEMLVAEALARGLDRDDLLVRRRLLQNMRFITPDETASEPELLARAARLDMARRDPLVRQRLIQRLQMEFAAAAADEPDAAEIAALTQRAASALAGRERVQFRHVYAGGDGAAARLQTLSQRPAEPAGEPFLLPARIGPATQAEIARDFGDAFAAAVMRVPDGQWSAPIRSAYGLHRVWIEQRWPAFPAAADDARQRARQALRSRRQQQAVADATRALRSRYRLRYDLAGERS